MLTFSRPQYSQILKSPMQLMLTHIDNINEVVNYLLQKPRKYKIDLKFIKIKHLTRFYLTQQYMAMKTIFHHLVLSVARSVYSNIAAYIVLPPTFGSTHRISATRLTYFYNSNRSRKFVYPHKFSSKLYSQKFLVSPHQIKNGSSNDPQDPQYWVPRKQSGYILDEINNNKHENNNNRSPLEPGLLTLCEYCYSQ